MKDRRLKIIDYFEAVGFIEDKTGVDKEEAVDILTDLIDRYEKGEEDPDFKFTDPVDDGSEEDSWQNHVSLGDVMEQGHIEEIKEEENVRKRLDST